MAASRVTVKVGEVWQTLLTGRGTAGYSWTWEVTGESGVVEVASEHLEGPSPPPAGGVPPAGYNRDEQATITALAPGSATVRFVLRRPWERDQPPLEELTIHLEVTGR